jgi:hypothetical protein
MNSKIQTSVANESIWVQIANFLRGLGEVLIAIGRAFVRMGEFIYEILFQ